MEIEASKQENPKIDWGFIINFEKRRRNDGLTIEALDSLTHIPSWDAIYYPLHVERALEFLQKPLPDAEWRTVIEHFLEIGKKELERMKHSRVVQISANKQFEPYIHDTVIQESDIIPESEAVTSESELPQAVDSKEGWRRFCEQLLTVVERELRKITHSQKESAKLQQVLIDPDGVVIYKGENSQKNMDILVQHLTEGVSALEAALNQSE